MAIETVGSLLSIILAFLIIWIIVSITIYIYFSLTLMITAKRLGVKNAWLAWIPLINIILFPKMAQKPSWPLIFVFIPLFLNLLIPNKIASNTIVSTIIIIMSLVGLIYAIYWFLKILKRRGKPWWWILLMLIPLFNIVWVFIMWGILAWGKDKEEGIKAPSHEQPNVNGELVDYLRKYHAQGHSISQLKQHLIREGKDPHEVDEAIKHLE